jgi:hypothetical protein
MSPTYNEIRVSSYTAEESESCHAYLNTCHSPADERVRIVINSSLLL